MFEMAVNLWNLAQKNGQLDTKHMVRKLRIYYNNNWILLNMQQKGLQQILIHIAVNSCQVRGYSYVGLKAHKPDGEMFAALHNRMSLQSKT